LNGDENPLHADPQRAKAAGFERPILHGAASFGIAARAILRECADYRPERLKSIEARFSRPVFPGDTVRTEMWREGEHNTLRPRGDVAGGRRLLGPVPRRLPQRDRAQQRARDVAEVTEECGSFSSAFFFQSPEARPKSEAALSLAAPSSAEI